MSRGSGFSGLPCAYVIKHGDLELRIAVVNISDLHLHEELVPGFLEELAREIEEDGLLRHPVIVDSGSLVVLDGMHRVDALRIIGCRRIPACLVDYWNPAITVGCWYRTLMGRLSLDEVLNDVLKEGFDAVKVSDIEPGEVGVSPNAAAVKGGGGAVVVRKPFRSLDEAYAVVKRVEEVLRGRGLRVGFETERDALQKFRAGEVDGVLMTPRVDKNSVISVALAGRLFPHKTTRHVIPARPLFLNIPLDLLRGDEPLEEVNAEVAKLLKARKLRMAPAGSLVEGRRYEEDVYIFE